MAFQTEELTVGFADIANFCSLVSDIGEEKLPHILQGIYSIWGDSIVENGGRIVKYIGDCVFFSFDQNRESAAFNCSIQMTKNARSMVQGLNIGLATGMVVSGEMGHKTHRQFDLLGETVNLAARLSHIGGIVLDERTFKAIGQNGEYEKISLEKDGKEVQVYRISS